MEGIIVLAVIFSIGVVVFWRSGRGKKRRAAIAPYNSDNPRDFLALASSWFSAPRPLGELLKVEPEQVESELRRFLNSESIMDRKTAVYAIGQVGSASFEPLLERFLMQEQVRGVREAAQAALVAVRQAPAERGYSEVDRCRIIDQVYYRR